MLGITFELGRGLATKAPIATRDTPMECVRLAQNKKKEVHMNTVSRNEMIRILKTRGWKDLRTRIGVMSLVRCPEYQIRAIYLSGKHYKRKEPALTYSI